MFLEWVTFVGFHPIGSIMNSPLNYRLVTSYWALVLAVVLGSFTNSFGQGLQREWVRTYANLTTTINRAKAIAMAPDGSIVVGGTSQNSEGDLDYQLIKYKPNGDEVWKARYGSAAQGNDDFRGMTIDPMGDVIVTGTTETVKFNSS